MVLKWRKKDSHSCQFQKALMSTGQSGLTPGRALKIVDWTLDHAVGLTFVIQVKKKNMIFHIMKSKKNFLPLFLQSESHSIYNKGLLEYFLSLSLPRSKGSIWLINSTTTTEPFATKSNNAVVLYQIIQKTIPSLNI